MNGTLKERKRESTKTPEGQTFRGISQGQEWPGVRS